MISISKLINIYVKIQKLNLEALGLIGGGISESELLLDRAQLFESSNDLEEWYNNLFFLYHDYGHEVGVREYNFQR
jgi:hypothetical protein